MQLFMIQTIKLVSSGLVHNYDVDLAKVGRALSVHSRKIELWWRNLHVLITNHSMKTR